MMRTGIVPILLAALLQGGCTASQPISTVDYVDMDRFMGDWYVIAHIPTFLDNEAHNAVESYRRGADGEIRTIYTYLDGGFDGSMKIMQPTGTVVNEQTNAEWGMQFVWPIKAEYLITYLDEDYQTTIVSRSRRDYVWIMARSPAISDDHYNKLLRLVEQQGYDIDKVRKVPHQWPPRQR